VESADGIAFSGKRTDGAYLTRYIAQRWIEVCLHGCRDLSAESLKGISGRFMVQRQGSAQVRQSFALRAQTYAFVQFRENRVSVRTHVHCRCCFACKM
jgi:predicted HicB family RNase H-like nuclease